MYSNRNQLFLNFKNFQIYLMTIIYLLLVVSESICKLTKNSQIFYLSKIYSKLF